MATTVKLSEQTRDRVNQIGAQTAQTADQVVATALDVYERAAFWKEYAVAAAAVEADPTSREREAADEQTWEATLRDGLDGA